MSENDGKITLWTEDQLLNISAFDSALQIGLQGFDLVLEATAETGSSKIESTHFLIALSRIPQGKILGNLSRVGLSQKGWISGLWECAAAPDSSPPPPHLGKQFFSGEAIAMLEEVASQSKGTIVEERLLASALRHATEPVRKLSTKGKISLLEWAAEFEDSLVEVIPIQAFADEGEIKSRAFSAVSFQTLTRACREAEALGAKSIDVRHLLLAFIEAGKSPLHYPAHLQGHTPQQLSEAVRMNLGPAAAGIRSDLTLDRDSIHPALQLLIEDAGEFAARSKSEVIGELHLAAELVKGKNAAARILENEEMKLGAVLQVIANSDYEEDPGNSLTPMIAEIETVRQRLYARLVGQDSVIERILPYIQRMRFGFRIPERPVGVFLFCGQSGCGKTEMAKEIARAVFGSEDELIFLEMGQFQNSESMSIFVGAPPGYVGFGQGKLTNGLRDKPRAVILFDEIEKATATVFDALLRFLDEGKIDDPAGPVRDGSDCIVVMTSNVGAKRLGKLSASLRGEPSANSIVRKKMREALEAEDLRPEFLNRVDEILLFETLTVSDYGDIAERMLEADLGRLREEHGIGVDVDPQLTSAIGDYCGKLGEGARLVRRLIQSSIITPVIDFVLSGGCPDPPVSVSVSNRYVEDDVEEEPVGVVSLNSDER